NPDGFSDYETGKVWDFRPTAPATAGAIPATSEPIHPDTSLPAIDQLDVMISALPADTAVVIVMPPVFYTYLPVPGSAAAAELGLCKSRLTRSTAGRPHSAFLDFLTDSDVARDPANFMDVDHMRSNVARSIDDRLAATLVSPER